MARPTGYTPELADRICAEIAAGKSLRAIAELKWAPSRRTITSWLRLHKEFADLYEIATKERAQAYFDEIIEIADREATDKGAVMRDRLRIDARKWCCARMDPERFGDRVMNEHTGAGGGPIVSRIELVDLSNDPGSSDSAAAET
ncbi:MAG TPA: hypothetical protein VF161_04350 [Steroidobacteraceae bacterium]